MKPQSMDGHLSVFNRHINDAGKRAKKAFIFYFGQRAWDEHLAHDDENGIMAIFDRLPTEFTEWYVAEVTRMVNASVIGTRVQVTIQNPDEYVLVMTIETESECEQISALDLKAEALAAVKRGEAVEYFRRPCAKSLAITRETVVFEGRRAGQAEGSWAVWGEWLPDRQLLEVDDTRILLRTDGSEA